VLDLKAVLLSLFSSASSELAGCPSDACEALTPTGPTGADVWRDRGGCTDRWSGPASPAAAHAPRGAPGDQALLLLHMGSDARKLAAREYGAQAHGAADLRVCEAKSAPALANFERLTARRASRHQPGAVCQLQRLVLRK